MSKDSEIDGSRVTVAVVAMVAVRWLKRERESG